jgi:predicted small secreted protein
MRHRIARLVALVAVGSFVLAACGGSDDAGDAIDAGDLTEDAAATENDDSSSDDGSSDSEDSSADESAAAFGEFVSGTISLSGAEDVTYAVDDPAFEIIGAGGCGGGSFGFTISATEADTGFTTLQLSAQVAEDLSGGGTGAFEVDDVSVIVVTDGDVGSSRSYDGPGTLTITEHDTGGPSADPNARRMAVELEGTLAGGGDTGDVDVAADVRWVMGCP